MKQTIYSSKISLTEHAKKFSRGIFFAAFAFLTLCLMPLLSFAADGSGKVYFLSIDYDGKGLSLAEVSLVKRAAADYLNQSESGYRADVLSIDNRILYSFRFAFPDTMCTDEFDENGKIISGSCVKKENGNFSLEIPYFPNGKAVLITDPRGDFVLSADISGFAELCGDNICEEGENYSNCAKDCGSGTDDGYCDSISEGVCDPDCRDFRDPDCGDGMGAGLSMKSLILAFLAVIFAGLLGYFAVKNWKKPKNSGA